MNVDSDIICILRKILKSNPQMFCYRAELTRKKEVQKPKQKRKPKMRLVSTWAEERVGSREGRKLGNTGTEDEVRPSNDKAVGVSRPTGRQRRRLSPAWYRE